MKNSFRRGNVDTQVWAQIMREQKQAIEWIKSGEFEKKEVLTYIHDIIQTGLPCDGVEEALFWGFDNPRSMPSDCRILYYYQPTYLVTAFMIEAFLIMSEELLQIPRFLQTFQYALNACTGRGFEGSGYDVDAGRVMTLEIFASVRTALFLKVYPDISPKFKVTLESVMESVKSIVADREQYEANLGEWESNHFDDFVRIYQEYNKAKEMRYIFVYGTLLEGERNHTYYLGNKKAIATATLKDHGLYDLGEFPGVKTLAGSRVIGEVYCINKKEKKQIDRLEGEGTLYEYKEVTINIAEEVKCCVGVYVYMGSIAMRPRVDCATKKWSKQSGSISKPTKMHLKEIKKENYVWYVSYGSNMLEERFLCYIKGGKYRGKMYHGCTNTSLPIMKMPYILPYDMYYANSSSTWDGGSVSFLDVTKSGKAYGVAYMITKEQFEEVCIQENGRSKPENSPHWYNHIVPLGDFDGVQVVTLTNNRKLSKGSICAAYYEVLNQGICESFKYLSNGDIAEYLKSR